MPHQLPNLPYPRDGLEPHISAETLDYHHGKHHRAYVDTLNKLVMYTGHANSSLEEIITTASDLRLFNEAAQVWNHNFYWKCMSPDGGGEPTGPVAEAIDSSFGSFQKFKEAFIQAGIELFGSGWVWLVKTGVGNLAIESTRDAVNPLVHGKIVLLTCDVWEHAYYVDYRNDKERYLDAFWHLVNWDFVLVQLESHDKSLLPDSKVAARRTGEVEILSESNKD